MHVGRLLGIQKNGWLFRRERSRIGQIGQGRRADGWADRHVSYINIWRVVDRAS